MKYIYVHGGPGLNSRAEQVILKDKFNLNNIDMLFWNEPQSYSTASPYLELSNSLVRFIKAQNTKVILVAHSSGCFNVINILPQIEDQVISLMFLAPAIDLEDMDRRIIDFAISIYKKDKNSASSLNSLISLKSKLTMDFDKHKVDALILAFGSNYFLFNFKDEQSFLNYFSHLTGDYEFKLATFFKIREDLTCRNLDINRTYDIPLISLYGKNDPIISVDDTQRRLCTLFKNNSFSVIQNVAHCPHIDATEEFISALKKLN